MRVLLLGSGGREHALAWAIAKSPLCEALFIAPGNPGMATLGTLVPLKLDDHAGIIAFGQKTRSISWSWARKRRSWRASRMS